MILNDKKEKKPFRSDASSVVNSTGNDTINIGVAFRMWTPCSKSSTHTHAISWPYFLVFLFPCLCVCRVWGLPSQVRQTDTVQRMLPGNGVSFATQIRLSPSLFWLSLSTIILTRLWKRTGHHQSGFLSFSLYTKQFRLLPRPRAQQ